MEVGELLKQERKKRGFTQTEMSAGVISTSYYAKVEKGIHQITVDNLIAILEIHEIDFFAFFQQVQHKRRPLEKSFREWVTSNITKDYYKQDQEHLKELKRTVIDNKNIKPKEREVTIALIDIVLANLKDEMKDIDGETKTVLKNWLFDGSTWNRTTLSLYCNIIDLYDFETNELFIQSILKKDLADYSTDLQLPIFVILLNFASDCIERNYDSLARHYLNMIEKEQTITENFFMKMMAKLLLLLLDTRAGKAVSRDEVNSIYQTMKLSGMEKFAETMEEFFEENCKINNS